MRTANFRDDVLWAIAYKAGLQPSVDFLKDQADAYASYINAWVRRLWDAADWPEWTAIRQFTLPPGGHTILFDQLPSDTLPNPTLIGKVLRAYLVDPRSTWGPVDTPFRISEFGYFVGFEHGPLVWLKYLPRAPKFTAREWDTDVTYKKGELVYSPGSGECFQSKSNGNRGHDPDANAESETLNVLTTEITQQFAPGNPGLPDTAQIVDVLARSWRIGNSLDDPPPAGQVFSVVVFDSDAVTVLGDGFTTADGVMTLDDVFSDLAAQLGAEALLSGFTISKLTGPLRIRIENLSGFIVQATYRVGDNTYPLSIQQIQAYIPVTAAAAATPKQIRLSISQEQVLPGEVYTLTFTSLDSAEHPVTYTSLGTDNAEQILAGLAAAVVSLQGADPFFTGVQSTLDTLSPALTFTIAPTIAKASLDAVIRPPGSVWWTYIPFPFALVDQVVRGAYADALKEQGQPDKAGPEEQAVPTEQTIRTAAFASKQFDGLSDQQIVHTRYSHGEK